MKQEELQKILDLHQKWLNDDPDGVRANLCYADLSDANLSNADLSGADIDYACWPLWCGGLSVNIDDRQAIQLLYHLVSNVMYSCNTSEEIKRLLLCPDIVITANKFHRVEELRRNRGKRKSRQRAKSLSGRE